MPYSLNLDFQSVDLEDAHIISWGEGGAEATQQYTTTAVLHAAGCKVHEQHQDDVSRSYGRSRSQCSGYDGCARLAINTPGFTGFARSKGY